MKFDYSRLSGRIVDVYGSRRKFAEAMRNSGVQMSEHTMSLKMNNKVYWKQPEINVACDLLGIPEDSIATYFFTQKVQNFERANI